MSLQEDFTGGSSYTGGEDECDSSSDWTPTPADVTGGGDDCRSWQSGTILFAALAAVFLILFILALTDKGGLDRMKDKLTVSVTEDEKEKLTLTIEDEKERLTSDGRYNNVTDADARAVIEVHGKVNNVAPDPAVQKVVSSYSDFQTANNPNTQVSSKARKGMNSSDAGSNRFAASETHANQEGSLWDKSGSFVERMSAGSHNNWTSGLFSESNLDPNRVYVDDVTVGQPMYAWGLSPARGPRGKTDLLLGAAAAGL